MTYFSRNIAYITQDIYYTIFRIGKRIILAPCKKLKKAQRYFKRAINWAYPLVMDIKKSAQVHCGKKWVLKMDIKDFYNSVPVEYTRLVLRNVCQRIKFADENYYFMLTTLDGKLPTGAPTSAHIANAAFSPVDKRIREYCKIYFVDYSRYMDDLTFSSDDKYLLNLVEKSVRETLGNFGYKLNESKTRYISDNRRQNVLGLVVNNKTTRIPKEMRKRLRAMIHSYSIYQREGAKVIDLKYRIWGEYELGSLKGYLAYTKHVDKRTYEKLMQYAKKLKVKL